MSSVTFNLTSSDVISTYLAEVSSSNRRNSYSYVYTGRGDNGSEFIAVLDFHKDRYINANIIGKKITSATLYMTSKNGTGVNGGTYRASTSLIIKNVRSIYKQNVGSVSDISCLTYSNSNIITYGTTSVATPKSDYGVYSFDVTNIIQAIVSGEATYGLAVMQNNNNTSTTKIYDKSSISLVINYTEPTKLTAPNNLYFKNASGASVGNDYTVDNSGIVYLKYEGAQNGDLYNITGYEVYRGESLDAITEKIHDYNGTYTQCNLEPPNSNGKSYYYKVKATTTNNAYDSDLSTAYAKLNRTNTPPDATNSNPIVDNHVPTPNTSVIGVDFTLPTDNDDGLKYTCIGVKKNNENTITQVAVTNDNTTTHITLSLNGYTIGATYTVYIRGCDQCDEFGEWKTNSVVSNAQFIIGSAPGNPTNFTINNAKNGFIKNNVSLSWNAPSSTGGLITTYKYYTSTDNGNTWVLRGATGASTYSVSVNISNIADETNVMFKVSAINDLGESSGVTSSNYTVNAYQCDIVIKSSYGSYVVKTYNSSPYIIFEYTKPTNGITLTKQCTIDGVAVSENDWVVDSTGDNVKVLIRCNNISESRHTVVVTITDGWDIWSTTTYFKRIIPVFTDNTLSVGDPYKIVHITELRAIVNEIQKYYNQTQTSWTDPEIISLKMFKKEYITEIRQSINNIVTFLRLYDPTVPVVSWTDNTIVSGYTPIKAVHITEIRNAIQLL